MKRMSKKISLMTLTVMASLSLIAQEIEVKGRVMDADDKQPVIGAIVTEKGSNRCTVTDVNGEFSIKTERGEATAYQLRGL